MILKFILKNKQKIFRFANRYEKIMKNKRFILASVIFALVFIFADSVFSFRQFSDFPLDGDLSNGTAPCVSYSKILQNPLGTAAIFKHERYAATNRFFLHWSGFLYYNKMPIILQSIGVNPINSVYLTCAILKLFTQFFIVLILSLFIKELSSLKKNMIPFVAVILISLFQTNGYEEQMGIIDKASSYAIAYGFPTLTFLFFLYPFVYYFANRRVVGNRWVTLFFLSILGYIIPFNGSLNCGLVSVFLFILFVSVLFNQYKKHKLKFVTETINYFQKIPIQLLIPLIIIGLFSLYSFYLGTFNAENDWATISLLERFRRLPIGFYNIMTIRIGFPIILVISTVNTMYVLAKASDETKIKLKFILKSLTFFSLVYLLLLPFGGYRTYREYIIRFDTFIPVTLCIFLYYTYSTVLAIQTANKWVNIIFISVALASVCFFTIIDSDRNYQNSCEKHQFQVLSESKSNKVELDCDCSVFSWGPLPDYNNSYESAVMLNRWHITKGIVLYRMEKK